MLEESELLEIRTEADLVGAADVCSAAGELQTTHGRSLRVAAMSVSCFGRVVVLRAEQEDGERRFAQLVGEVHGPVRQDAIAVSRQLRRERLVGGLHVGAGLGG